MPEVIFLIGAPGTGKSTYVKKINAEGKYTVISSDDIIEELGKVEGLDYPKAFEKHGRFATKEIFNRAEHAIKNNENVIWDQTNMNKKARKKKIDMFPKEYVKKAVVFGVDEYELKKRLQKRAEETGKFIPANVVKSMLASYEAPDRSEGFTSITRI